MVMPESRLPGCPGTGLACREGPRSSREPRLKILLWLILAIFLIGLAVVIGTGALIF